MSFAIDDTKFVRGISFGNEREKTRESIPDSKKCVYIYIYTNETRGNKTVFQELDLDPPFAKTSRKLWVVFVWCSRLVYFSFFESFWCFLVFSWHCLFSKVNYEFKGKAFCWQGKAFSWHPLSLFLWGSLFFKAVVSFLKQSLFFEVVLQAHIFFFIANQFRCTDPLLFY